MTELTFNTFRRKNPLNSEFESVEFENLQIGDVFRMYSSNGEQQLSESMVVQCSPMPCDPPGNWTLEAALEEVLSLVGSPQELLGCPFCGGKAEQIDFSVDKDSENAGGSVIQCSCCGASGPVHFDRKENLLSHWNARASLPR